MNKNNLIETLRIERARWDMLLVQVDSDRMTVPGVVGEMSLRDILADVVQHEKYAAWQLKRAMFDRDEPAASQSERRSSRVGNRASATATAAADLLEESRRTFEAIVRMLMRLSDEDIFGDRRDAAGDRPVAALVPDCTFEHYRKYDPDIRRWMASRKRRRSRSSAATS
jgi:chitodextrinase